MERADFSEFSRAELEHLLNVRNHQIKVTRRVWLKAAESALAGLPGASNSGHPAHALWIRVQMANEPPLDIVQSGARKA